MTDVVMPQMGESIVEGTLTKWLKKAGDHVERDEPLFEISTDKVDTEIPAPSAGTLSEILVPEGQTVGINTVVARIEDGRGCLPPPLRSLRRQPPSRFPPTPSRSLPRPPSPPALSPRSSANWRASTTSISAASKAPAPAGASPARTWKLT